MSLLCAAVALLVEFRRSLVGPDGSGDVVQGGVELEDAPNSNDQSKEHIQNIEGEEALAKRLEVS